MTTDEKMQLAELQMKQLVSAYIERKNKIATSEAGNAFWVTFMHPRYSKTVLVDQIKQLRKTLMQIAKEIEVE